LLWALENLVAGTVLNAIRVPEEVAVPARRALQTMLTITG